MIALFTVIVSYIFNLIVKQGEKERDGLVCGEYNKIDLDIVNRDEFMQGSMPLVRLTEDLPGVQHDILINPQGIRINRSLLSTTKYA